MVRIAHIITSLNTGGAESMMVNLLARMDRRRFDPIVISLGDKGPVGVRIARLNVPVFSCGMRPGYPNPCAALRLLRALRRFRPDLAHGWMYHGNLAALLPAAAGLPVIWSVFSTQSNMRQEKFSTALAVRLGALLSRWPARIISDSKAGADTHQRLLNFSGARWEIIPNGFDLDQFHPSGKARAEVRTELSLAPESTLIGMIGRYHAVKNHAGFLRAAALLRRRLPEARFLLAGRGTGNNAALFEQARELGLSGAVHFLGETPDLPRLASALDILVSASHSESLPTVVGEAMCCGVPCVVTDVGDSAWLVGETGLAVPPGVPGALAEACEDLVRRGRQARLALGHAARRRIEERFSIGAAALRYETVYQQALSASAGSAG
jgi:glycosyltransferase involved in cell wall biosynthesis